MRHRCCLTLAILCALLSALLALPAAAQDQDPRDMASRKLLHDALYRIQEDSLQARLAADVALRDRLQAALLARIEDAALFRRANEDNALNLAASYLPLDPAQPEGLRGVYRLVRGDTPAAAGTELSPFLVACLLRGSASNDLGLIRNLILRQLDVVEGMESYSKAGWLVEAAQRYLDLEPPSPADPALKARLGSIKIARWTSLLETHLEKRAADDWEKVVDAAQEIVDRSATREGWHSMAVPYLDAIESTWNSLPPYSAPGKLEIAERKIRLLDLAGRLADADAGFLAGDADGAVSAAIDFLRGIQEDARREPPEVRDAARSFLEGTEGIAQRRRDARRDARGRAGRLDDERADPERGNAARRQPGAARTQSLFSFVRRWIERAPREGAKPRK